MLRLNKQSANQNNIERLIIVSNRLPVVMTKGKEGEWHVQPGSGGLVTALAPVLRDSGGLWIGWAGTFEDVKPDELMAITGSRTGYDLKPVRLTPEEINGYYFGFSNEILWPLFHSLQTRCNFDPAYWTAYQAVNRKFAQVIAENARANDYIWVHDYHLMLVAKELRAMGVECKIGFFLHTPFPPRDVFAILPWRSQIMSALAEYDLVGFQTMRDRNNFIHSIESLIKCLHVDTRRQVSMVVTPQRQTRDGSFPIGIDFNEFSGQADSKSVLERAKQLHDAMNVPQIILGVDRLDYSKGIPERFKSFRNALERFDELRGKVTLVQIVVPSREEVPEYQVLKAEIERLVGEINGKYGQAGWIPINYMFRSLEKEELLAYYRAADIALITPLRDGMNLVAKEYCAANLDNNGVLILSEFAGAATQLRTGALVVNPYDIEGVANAIYRAYSMSPGERQSRMRRLRQSVAKRDVFWWVDFFLWSATTNSLDDLRPSKQA